MGITLAFILTAQLPIFTSMCVGRRDRFNRPKGATPDEVQRNRAARQARTKRPSTNDRGAKIIQPLWLPYGALGLAENRVLPALLGTFGCLGLGVSACGGVSEHGEILSGVKPAAWPVPAWFSDHHRSRFARQTGKTCSNSACP